MSSLGSIIDSLESDLGAKDDAASTTGSANAKLASLLALLPLVNGTAGVSKGYPNLANAIVLSTHASAWTYGSYTQIVAASTLAAHMLLGLVVTAVGQDDEYQVMIGTGGGGSETDLAEFRFRTVSGGQMQVIPFPDGPRIIPANARIAGKAASKLGGASATVAIWVAPRPLA
jgi:hypothetical protein